MDQGPISPQNSEQTLPKSAGHHGEQCPFVQLMTPEIMSHIEAAIALAREAGRHDLSAPLDAWLVRVMRVTATISEEGECGPELYIG
jgi:hypothetical protein